MGPVSTRHAAKPHASHPRTPLPIMSRLMRVVMMIRPSQSIAEVADFYHSSLGLPIRRLTDDWAELSLENNSNTGCDTSTTIQLLRASSEAQASTGYSPILTLQVGNLDELIAQSCQKGAHLDGPIQYQQHGKTVALRTPDGHMIGLYEPNSDGSA